MYVLELCFANSTVDFRYPVDKQASQNSNEITPQDVMKKDLPVSLKQYKIETKTNEFKLDEKELGI